MTVWISATDFGRTSFGCTDIIDSVAYVLCTILAERVSVETPKFYKSSKKHFVAIIFTITIPNFSKSILGVLAVMD